MASPTVPWGIPQFDDNSPFAPVQAPLNAQSAALNTALNDGAFRPYTTKALLDAAPGTRIGQHASVYADGTVANNGDYTWSGSKWAAASKSPVRGGTVTATTTQGGDIVITFAPPFTTACAAVVFQDANTGGGIGPVPIKLLSRSASGAVARVMNGTLGVASFNTTISYIAFGD